VWYGVSEESLHTYEASGLSHSEGFTNYSVDLASASDWDEGSGYSAIVIDDLDRESCRCTASVWQGIPT